ncbi:type IV pilus modification protein PilV [Parashewanella spongiae]|uniref:Type IV pilus modification protein PilV n=2 Tax=Parashewanella spongiae TaxID=342950 RepID=A0A3A6TRJ4_9GAMM|nr:type IV pilus modification protein PilV [Parashewanella spongiae]
MNGNEKGLSLVEVLVALVILAIGLVGVFNLHIVSKQGSFESYQHTQAAYLAHDIVNRIKVNRTELANYLNTDGYDGSLSAPATLCNNINNQCSPAQMRLADLYSWEQLLIGNSEMLDDIGVGGLDTPVACITQDDDLLTVAISWRSIRETSDGATGHYSGVAQDCGADGNRRRLYTVTTVIRI